MNEPPDACLPASLLLDLETTQQGAVCVAGGGGGGAPACCVSLEKVLATCGFGVADMIPVRRQNLEAKRTALERAGAEIASWASTP